MHLQINARVWAAGAWRGLHTVGVRDSLEAINGIGHAAVMTNPEFRAVLAELGYTLDPETGEVTQLAGYTGAFSARSRQIEANIERYEAQWRRDHLGREPGPAIRQAWDRRAWADARPDKVVPISGADLRDRWIEELIDLGFQAPKPRRARQVGPIHSTRISDQTYLVVRLAWLAHLPVVRDSRGPPTPDRRNHEQQHP